MAGQFLFTRHLLPGQHPTTFLAWLLAVVIVAPILTHRRFPRASVVVCLGAVAIYATGRYVAYPGIAIFVLTFDIALHSEERIAVPTLFASAVVTGVAIVLQPAKVAVLSEYIVSEIGVGWTWLIGWNLRRRRARWAELRARAERLEREREEEARKAVAEERLRIARELHDVIAHSMSVIAVQSAVGNHVIDTQPRRPGRRWRPSRPPAAPRSPRCAACSACCARRASRGAASPRRPAWPTWRRSSPRSRTPGSGSGSPSRASADRFPPGMDLSAYRIVQEALTNVIKHAGAATASVTVRYAADAVTVEITDDGRRAAASAAAPGPAPGTGIIGMRERVALFGGELAAGPGPDGGYRVRARFPLAERGP